MDQPFRTFDMCERFREYHGRPEDVVVQVWKSGWRWGPFAGGTVRWGDEVYRVWATRWFSLWFKAMPTGSVSNPPSKPEGSERNERGNDP